MKKPTKTTVRRVKGWTLEDAAHFIIYRELDKMGVHFPYEKSTRICEELRAAVNYRTYKLPTKRT